MKMPGFTAEVSLYEPKRHYRTAGTSDSATPRPLQAVVPQDWCKIGGKWVECFSLDPTVTDHVYEIKTL